MKAVSTPAAAALANLFCLLLLNAACTRQPTQLEQILAAGEITVVTRTGSTTYYRENDKERGFAYELASRFADYLDVELKVIVVGNNAELIDLLQQGKADFAAASLINNSFPDRQLLLAPTHQWLSFHLVYRNGGERPAHLEEIPPDKIHIAGDSIPSTLLDFLQANHPELQWEIHPELDTQDLLAMIETGAIAYTIADSNELILARNLHPEIRPALIVGSPSRLAWAFRRNDRDLSLVREAQVFQQIEYESGDLADLFDSSFGHTGEYDYMDSRNFIDRYALRLPDYRALFEQAASEYQLDWLLLAALSYQESHWDHSARSATGVRGLMMLTRNTATSLGVKNRSDPEQSILGGAEYLAHMMEKIPARIQDPDRRWFALASYNIGYAHLEDARILTERNGGNPDLWEEVKGNLPLLSRKKWFKTTRHGYARGYQTVEFVEHIRKYYSILVQLTQPQIEPFERQVERLYSDSQEL